MKPVTEQQKAWVAVTLNGFFLICKTVTAIVLILSIVLVVSQSTVAPVSTRLLTAYVMQYSVQTVKPYRVLFPKPYTINLEEETR